MRKIDSNSHYEEITENAEEQMGNLAIEFAEWLGDKTFYKNTWFDECNHSMGITTSELYQEFIKYKENGDKN